MSSTPDPAGNQQGSRGSGGGGRTRSANKRRNKKKNADTSPPLPDLQAQTLFTPGTTGGAADEETVNTTKLIEIKRASKQNKATPQQPPKPRARPRQPVRQPPKKMYALSSKKKK